MGAVQGCDHRKFVADRGLDRRAETAARRLLLAEAIEDDEVDAGQNRCRDDARHMLKRVGVQPAGLFIAAFVRRRRRSGSPVARFSRTMSQRVCRRAAPRSIARASKLAPFAPQRCGDVAQKGIDRLALSGGRREWLPVSCRVLASFVRNRVQDNPKIAPRPTPTRVMIGKFIPIMDAGAVANFAIGRLDVRRVCRGQGAWFINRESPRRAGIARPRSRHNGTKENDTG